MGRCVLGWQAEREDAGQAPFSSHLSMAGTHRATAETGVSSSLLCLGSISQLFVLFMARRSAAATVGCWPCPGVRVPVAFQATVWISAPLLPGWVTFSHCLSCRIHSDISPPCILPWAPGTVPHIAKVNWSCLHCHHYDTDWNPGRGPSFLPCPCMMERMSLTKDTQSRPVPGADTVRARSARLSHQSSTG